MEFKFSGKPFLKFAQFFIRFGVMIADNDFLPKPLEIF